MGRKSGDEWAIPLCTRHHAELHANGDETMYLQQRGIDGVKAAEKIFKKYKKRYLQIFKTFQRLVAEREAAKQRQEEMTRRIFSGEDPSDWE